VVFDVFVDVALLPLQIFLFFDVFFDVFVEHLDVVVFVDLLFVLVNDLFVELLWLGLFVDSVDFFIAGSNSLDNGANVVRVDEDDGDPFLLQVVDDALVERLRAENKKARNYVEFS
jgi:hypothetical protein